METLIGQQFPTIEHLPQVPVIASSLGAEAVDLASIAKLYLDPWQEYCLDNMLATTPETFWNEFTSRNENRWAAFEVGITVSRQNGKGSILEARELAGLFILGERLIIHSAHQFDTSKEAFTRVLGLIEDCPDLDREVMRVSRSHGEEGIEVRVRNPLTGARGPLQRLRFRTRTAGGGRGFTADCLILDEDMYLDKAQVGALMPTLSARPNPQLIYTGSAGDKKSTQKGRVRARALSGNGGKLFYAEWSASYCNPFCIPGCDEHDQPGDPRTHAKTNPGLGIRLSLEHIESERESMDPDTFGQERHGVGDWPVEGNGWVVIDEESWTSRKDESSSLVGEFALALAVAPDRSWSCITATGLNEKGDTHSEITADDDQYDYRPGVQWAVPRIVEIVGRNKPACIVIDKATQAGGLVAELEKALDGTGVDLVFPAAREFAQSCGELVSAVIPRKGERATLVHLNQPALNVAISALGKRTLAGLYAWIAEGSDITPAVGITLSGWGFKEFVFGKTAADPWVFRG